MTSFQTSCLASRSFTLLSCRSRIPCLLSPIPPIRSLRACLRCARTPPRLGLCLLVIRAGVVFVFVVALRGELCEDATMCREDCAAMHEMDFHLARIKEVLKQSAVRHMRCQRK